MTASAQAAKAQKFHRVPLLEEHRTLCAKFEVRRFDIDFSSAPWKVLGFVQGLRFSALLIYSMRRILKKILTGSGLTASWGLIRHGDEFSRECDIVVHREVDLYAWDGHDDFGGPVMDFRFVRREDVALVISCKSKLSGISGDMCEYAQDLRRYVDRLWLFAECREDASASRLAAQAAKAGYERLWCLYRVRKSGKPGPVYDEEGWLRFAHELRGLGDGLS